jgi:hypothetical protein
MRVFQEMGLKREQTNRTAKNVAIRPTLEDRFVQSKTIQIRENGILMAVLISPVFHRHRCTAFGFGERHHVSKREHRNTNKETIPKQLSRTLSRFFLGLQMQADRS